MKIIAHIPYGYLVAMSRNELSLLTGNKEHSRGPDDHYDRGPLLKINAEVEINETWKDLNKLRATTEERRRIAENLRAAATIIEHTPDPLTVKTTTAAENPTLPES